MQDFTSAEWSFKARFPGKPKEQTQSGPFGTTMTMYGVESRDGVYAVAIAALPIPAGESPEMLQNRLDGSRDGAIGNVGGKLQSSKSIMLNGKYPGCEFSATITKPKQGQIRAKIYLVEARLYQVMVMGSDSYATSSQANDFLDSFQLLR
jgi:hypothetical protein